MLKVMIVKLDGLKMRNYEKSIMIFGIKTAIV